ncbi:aminotransferase class III-fold pyridoxal phosphate-dependent enzyme [Chitinophaga sp. 22321]|uniref:Aminotransferase class III-fold pyridoxal phosphate-dependent enzyme n=1 Tax=Chitinophaga hostae TaxID=2831022 RepID=A0ABS5J9D2_9BACT|nr:aminotransferase class III-fold pyridoxal phosphate-dependent enzyme [Chitinophaga hostae]MBS0031785.1 aminotransferase class III-fold pyridoxal phosphate-dependent enzyme [Chitinophaga hostae]
MTISNLRHRGKKPKTYLYRDGYYLVDNAGKKLLDLSGGTLVQTLYETTSFPYNFENYMFTPSYGVTTPEIERLEARMLERTKQVFDDMVWCSSGSDAIEMALKLVLHHATHMHPDLAPAVAVLKGAYHGNTLFASVLNDRIGKRSNLSKAAVEVLVLDNIETAPLNIAAYQQRTGKQLISVVVDPINITGDFGYSIEQLNTFVKAMEDLHVITIFDEIACGCYRHGYFSIATAMKTPPRITILSKGLTNGITPLSVLLLNNIGTDTLPENSLSFGHTFGINPFSERICSWVMERYDKLEASGQMKALSDCLQKQALALDSIPGIQARAYVHLLRITITDKTCWHQFKATLTARQLSMYETIDYDQRYTFIVAPPYDMAPAFLCEIFSGFIHEFKSTCS